MSKNNPHKNTTPCTKNANRTYQQKKLTQKTKKQHASTITNTVWFETT
jgi:hypothetical protein